jgi:hypothetical protein
MLIPAVGDALQSGNGVRTALRVLSIIQRGLREPRAIFSVVFPWLSTVHVLDAAFCMLGLAKAHAEVRELVVEAFFALLPLAPRNPRIAIEKFIAEVLYGAKLSRDPYLPTVIGLLGEDVDWIEQAHLFFLAGTVCQAVTEIEADDPCAAALLALAQHVLARGELDYAAAGFHLFSALVPKLPVLFPQMAECASSAINHLLTNPPESIAGPWLFSFFTAAARAYGDAGGSFFEPVLRAIPPFLGPDAPEDTATQAWEFVAVAFQCAPSVFGGEILALIARAIVEMREVSIDSVAIYQWIAEVIERALAKHAEYFDADLLLHFFSIVQRGLSLSLENAHPVRQALARAAVQILKVHLYEVSPKTVEGLLGIVYEWPEGDERQEAQNVLAMVFGESQAVSPLQAAEETDLTGERS